MSANTNIGWTEKTWNPVVGCSVVSPGCARCYAATMAKRLRAMGRSEYQDVVDDDGRWTGKLALLRERLAQPLGWKKPAMIFVNSMSDLFHEDVNWDFLDDVFATMYECQWHTFQVLTKRPSRMREYVNSKPINRIAHKAWWHLHSRSTSKANVVTPEEISSDIAAMWPLPNLWLGVSCEDQKRAGERIPDLLGTPAAIRFISAEPLLGPIDFRTIRTHEGHLDVLFVGDEGGAEYVGSTRQFIDWIIIGGESGPCARPCSLAWVREIVRQCQSANVACFVKQLGRNPTWSDCDISEKWYERFSDHKGANLSEWPFDLRVQEFPKAR